MIKKLIFPIILVTISALAVDFVQFTEESYNLYNTTQDWTSAQMITLSVKKGQDIYLTNYIRSWYEVLPDLGAKDYLAGYDMSANKYGYVYAEKLADGSVRPIGDIYYGDGLTKEVTIKNPTGPQEQTLTGYHLGMFDKDAEIFLVMTPNGYDETVDSFSLVNANDYPSILASRQINTYDLAGQTRVNFGTVDKVAHEFVIGYEASATPSGQPLPGVLTTALLSMCTVGVISKRKNRRKE